MSCYLNIIMSTDLLYGWGGERVEHDSDTTNIATDR
jgi:hypothetical protein